MKRPALLFRSIFIASLLLFGAGMASAQLVLIPDTNMRAWLNMMAPGSVNGTGYLDTQSPALVMPPWVYSVDLNVNWAPSDLTGLQYLQGIEGLTVTYTQPGGSVLPAFPDSLDRIALHGFPGAVLPALPSSLTKLFLYDCIALGSVPALPSGMEMFQLVRCQQVGALPTLPADLYHMILEECTNLGGLPPLPGSLSTLAIASCPLLGPTLSLNAVLWSLELEDLPLLTSVVGTPTIPNVLLRNMPVLSTLPPLVSTCGQGSILIENVPNLPLPTGPWNAYSIRISNMPWTSLPPTPCAATLSLISLPLGTLPAFPPTLSLLHIDSVPATGILNLPAGLMDLHVERSAITEIAAWPDVPEKVVIVNCDQLTTLPSAPLSSPDSVAYVDEVEFRDCPLLAELPGLFHPLQLTIAGLPPTGASVRQAQQRVA